MSTVIAGSSLWRDRDESPLPHQLLIGFVLAGLLVLEGFRYLVLQLVTFLVLNPFLAFYEWAGKVFDAVCYCLRAWYYTESGVDHQIVITNFASRLDHLRAMINRRRNGNRVLPFRSAG